MVHLILYFYSQSTCTSSPPLPLSLTNISNDKFNVNFDIFRSCKNQWKNPTRGHCLKKLSEQLFCNVCCIITNFDPSKWEIFTKDKKKIITSHSDIQHFWSYVQVFKKKNQKWKKQFQRLQCLVLSPFFKDDILARINCHSPWNYKNDLNNGTLRRFGVLEKWELWG